MAALAVRPGSESSSKSFWRLRLEPLEPLQVPESGAQLVFKSCSLPSSNLDIVCHRRQLLLFLLRDLFVGPGKDAWGPCRGVRRALEEL